MSEAEVQILGWILVGSGIACFAFRRRLAKEKKEMNEAWGMRERSSAVYIIGAAISGIALFVAGVAVLLWSFSGR